VRPFPIPVVETRPAEDLVELFASAHANYQKGLEGFIASGHDLLKAKEKAGRGNWLKELKKRWKFSQQRASQLMQLAVASSTSNLTHEQLDEKWRQIQGNGPENVREGDQDREDVGAAPTGHNGEQAPPKESPLDLEGDPERAARRLELGTVAPSHKLGRPGEFVPLEEWDSWDDERRQRLWEDLRDAPSASTAMTFQDGDSIEWARWSWNPVTGCLHNCPYCYARDLANRLYDPKLKFAPALWPARLHAPRNVKVPADKIAAVVGDGPHARAERTGLKSVFVCSMADLFGRWVPAEWIEAVLAEVRAAPQWNFLFLTKFPIRMAEFDFPGNAWVGTTVDCQARVAAAEKAFRKVRAGVKWLSVEPLIERLKFTDLGAFQ
jgi:protein gp37